MEVVPKGLCGGSWRGEAVGGCSRPWGVGRGAHLLSVCGGNSAERYLIRLMEEGETLLQWDSQARGAVKLKGVRVRESVGC